ncbi:hypothetical protein HDV00_011750 [Rhizophlyctis rosea]|nr:hypothetical protein HDV00_011750 [Rhizophlyctis rosea]
MTISNVLILGGGMCGVASAIALAKDFPQLNITIYELRSKPSTIGGAVNLTPTAAKGLDILGVLPEMRARGAGHECASIQLFSLHTGGSLGVIDYKGEDGTGYDGHKGWRVSRGDLLLSMVAAAEKLGNVRFGYGKKVVDLEESDEDVKVKFEDGTGAVGDLVLGCDGIHSATRTKFVDPDRVPTYSGISSAYAFTKTSDVLKEGESLFFEDAGLAMSRAGALLTAYSTPGRDTVYVASVMEMKEQVDKEGWRALGKDQKSIKEDLLKRFADSPLGKTKELIQNSSEWFLYPVFILPGEGKWATKRVILLGDAAHAMPPKGESIGYALEDAIIFSTIVKHFGLNSAPSQIFAHYEKVRRKPVNAAYEDSKWGWGTNKDLGWFTHKFFEFVTPLYLWWSAKDRDMHFKKDPRKVDFS